MYLINIQSEAQSIFKYDSENDARSAYHSTLASNYAAYDAGTLNSFTVVLMNQSGDVVAKEFKYRQEG